MEHAYQIQGEENRERFVFNSGEGKETIQKVVCFDLIDAENRVFNLGMGYSEGDPWDETTKIDFEVLSNKGDVLKVMNTVALCVELFLEKNPDAKIFFTGSTEKRTRIYLKLIARNWTMLQQRFEIMGVTDFDLVDFEPGQKYYGVVFSKKNVI